MISELQRDVPGQDPTWGALVRRLGGNAVIGAAFALLYAVLVWLGHELNDVAVRMAILWPAAGLLLALLWLAPLRVWPLFIALQVGVEFAVSAAMHSPLQPGQTALFILANSTNAMTGALIARTRNWRHHSVLVQQVLKFAFAAGCGAAVSATVGALATIGGPAGIGYFDQWLLLLASSWLGALVIAPVIYTWAVPTRRIFKALQLRSRTEVLLFAVLSVPVTWAVFPGSDGDATSLLETPVALVLLLVAAAFRLPPRWSTLIAAATILLAAALASRGTGLFDVGDPSLRVLQLQAFLAALAVVTFVITVFVAEMRIGLARLTESENRYRSFFDQSSEAVWRVELAEPMPVSLPVAAQRDWLQAHAYIAECNATFDRMQGGDPEHAPTIRRWRRDLPWVAAFESNLEHAVQRNYSMDGVKVIVPSGGKPHTFLTSFSGQVSGGYLLRIWGDARDVSEIVDLNTRLLREQERLKSYARQIVTAEERARRATAVDLHDGIAQSLVGTAMTLGFARDQAPPTLQVLIDEARANLRLVQERTRNMIADLSPPGLYDLGLGPALHWLAIHFREHDKLHVILDANVREDAVPMELRVLIFKLVRELLRNVVKHSGVDSALLTVRGDADTVRIEVVDSGKGFEWQMDMFGGRVGGFGLWSIVDRVNDVGGELKVDTAPGRGSRFELQFPLRRVDDAVGDDEAMQKAG